MSSTINQINLITKKEIWPKLIDDLWFVQSSIFLRFIKSKNPKFVPFDKLVKEEQIQERMFFISIFDSSEEYSHASGARCESCSEELNTKILEIEEKKFMICQFCFNYLRSQEII